MSAPNAAFAPMHASLFARFAAACTVVRGTDAVALRCIVEDGVARIGQYGQVIGRVTRVSFIKSEWAPQRADVVTLDGVARKVEDIESDDGLVVTAVLHG